MCVTKKNIFSTTMERAKQAIEVLQDYCIPLLDIAVGKELTLSDNAFSFFAGAQGG
jgi:hypothetical protein